MTTRYYYGEGSDGGRHRVVEYDDAPPARGAHVWKLASGHELLPTERDGEFRAQDLALTVWIDLSRPSRF